MNEVCEATKFCQNIALVERIVSAPFSMTGTSSQQKKKIKICNACAAQDERMALTGDKE
jgi:hypothetical protein